MTVERACCGRCSTASPTSGPPSPNIHTPVISKYRRGSTMSRSTCSDRPLVIYVSARALHDEDGSFDAAEPIAMAGAAPLTLTNSIRQIVRRRWAYPLQLRESQKAKNVPIQNSTLKIRSSNRSMGDRPHAQAEVAGGGGGAAGKRRVRPLQHHSGQPGFAVPRHHQTCGSA